MELSEKEKKKLDHFEGDEYRAVQVRIQQKDQAELDVWVYVWNGSRNDLDETRAWDFGIFEKQDLASFIS